MVINYFKIAWRNLKKNKFYSFINIFGLALGMSCSFLIWLWVQDELSYNRFFPDHEEVYFVRRNVTAQNGQVLSNFVTPRSEEHTSELQSLMRISYAVFCLKKKISKNN